MIARVRTGSRLHFGLLNPSAVPLPRLFGGAGMMIDAPSLAVSVSPGKQWSATGPLAERALGVARLLGGAPCRITVEEAPPAHAGLGSGTQLALAVATACRALRGESLEVPLLAHLTRRGRRSAIGVHGFAQGGFLVDGGKQADDLAPLLSRIAFPEDWRIVLALPDGPTGLAGSAEQSALDTLPPDERRTASLCRVLLLGVLPALVEADLPRFGAALGEYNARAGELFLPAQGGIYASPVVEAMVNTFRRLGIEGTGQSSWGPGVFAVADPDRAAWLVNRVPGAMMASGRNISYNLRMQEN